MVLYIGLKLTYDINDWKIVVFYTSYSLYYDRGDTSCLYTFINARQNMCKYGGTNSTLSHLVHFMFLEGLLCLRRLCSAVESERIWYSHARRSLCNTATARSWGGSILPLNAIGYSLSTECDWLLRELNFKWQSTPKTVIVPNQKFQYWCRSKGNKILNVNF